ncbi:MAG: HDIG domain-containing protein [Deinococcales bacterium]
MNSTKTKKSLNSARARPQQTAQELIASWQFWFWALAFAIALAFILDSSYISRQTKRLEVGKPSPQNYKSPIDTTIVNQIETERKRQVARSQVEAIYSADPQLQSLVLDAISRWDVPESIKNLIVASYDRPEGLSETERKLIIDKAVAIAPPPDRFALRRLLEGDLIATSILDSKATEDAREAAASAISPITQQLLAGQTIVREGSILTAEQLRVLERLGMYTPKRESIFRSGLRILGSITLAALASLALFYAYVLFQSELSYRQLGFLAVVVLLALVAQRLTLTVHEHFWIITLVPLVIAAILSNRAALILSVWLSFMVALMLPQASFELCLSLLPACLIASLASGFFHARISLILAGICGSLVAILSLLAYKLLLAGLDSSFLLSSIYILAGGILAGVFALGLLPLFESVGGFITEFKLLDLINPNEPLLQRMLSEAPGDYQHSMVISNLVEQAVRNIGGNVLLARVGAMYHDIGKLKRPSFFSENQFVGINPHDDISPHLSYLIIVAHVRDGLEMAREYKLPKALEPFIAEHHGTTVLSYFYKKALESSPQITEFSFRYAGPKPQTKESAVLMLADAIESASRSLDEPSRSNIRSLIDRLIQQRLDDDQLAESPLNFRDLDIIANTFERALIAILHRRVKYPSAEEIKRLQQKNASDQPNLELAEADELGKPSKPALS